MKTAFAEMIANRIRWCKQVMDSSRDENGEIIDDAFYDAVEELQNICSDLDALGEMI